MVVECLLVGAIIVVSGFDVILGIEVGGGGGRGLDETDVVDPGSVVGTTLMPKSLSRALA